MQTDYIDLLLIHEPYEAAPEMYRAMEEACAGSLVRAVGLSNFSGQEYLAFLKHCRVTPAVDQVEAHVYHPQLGLKKLLEEKGTRMQAWSPFTQGRRNIFADPVLAEAGRRHGKTAAQAALRYLVEQGVPVLPKSAHRQRLRENLDIFDFSLTAGDRAAIAALDEGKAWGSFESEILCSFYGQHFSRHSVAAGLVRIQNLLLLFKGCIRLKTPKYTKALSQFFLC